MSKGLPQQDIYTAKQLKRTASDLILDYLLQIDVDHIFGIPGGAIEPLFDAVARLQRRGRVTADDEFAHKVLSRQHQRQQSGRSPLKMVVARHEAGAAFMADGYSRETGRLGVCCSTTGPGSTNLITGIATAYVDRIPMLVITPQIALPNFGRQSFQDSSGDAIDIVDMLKPCTRYNTFVSHVGQLEGKLFEAIYTAFCHPRGPVHLSIPMDIMDQQMEIERPSFHVATMLRQSKSFDEQNLKALSDLLLKSKKVVFFLGEGCLKEAAAVVRFAEMINAEIVTTPAGKGCVSAYHPLYKGVFGFAGHQSARETLSDESVDIVLAVGTALGEFETGGWDVNSLLNEKLVHIDSERENFSRSPMARLHLHGHLGALFVELISQLSKCVLLNGGKKMQAVDSAPYPSQQNRISRLTLTPYPSNVVLDSRRDCTLSVSTKKEVVKPQFLMCELARKVPSGTRFYIDTGNAWAWATHYLHLKKAGCYHVSMGFGAMAWAIGAAIGSAAATNRPAVCITGDGAYLMSAQEITVAVEHRLPVIFVILNDQALGMIKHGQRLGGGEPIAYELPTVDFAQIARAVGADAVTVRSSKELMAVDLKALCRRQGPTLIDVHIDPEEVPPMGARMETLERKTAVVSSIS